MDSQLATVLTSGSLDVQNGKCAEGSGLMTEVLSDQKGKTSSDTPAGNLQPCPVKAVAIRQDVQSINGTKPEVGGTSKPASQDTSKSGGFRQPITVKTGMPILRSQPIRIKIVVPPRYKRPITNSAISLTKDFARSHLRRPVLISAGTVITGTNSGKIQLSTVKNEGEIKEVSCEKTEVESFHGTEVAPGEKRDVLDAEIIHTDGTGTPLIFGTNAMKILSWQGIKEENFGREVEKNIPLILQEVDLKSCERFDGVEEQTEPLDLSLPKKRENRGRFLDDSVCESSLIMEVDEYEGEGDRDIVEEDDDVDRSVCCMDGSPEGSLLSPSFFSTSVFTSLSSIDCDTENLLLIDDQGIPYTLSPDGLKVPQVDVPTLEDPQSDQAERKGSLAGPNLSQSSDNALNAPCDGRYLSPAPATDSPSVGVDHKKAPEAFTGLIMNSHPSKASEGELCVKSVQEPNPALSQPSGVGVSSQPLQILTNPSNNAPILLLSSSSSSPPLSSAALGLSLPLSVTQASHGASAPMYFLLSSVTSPSGDSASTSTPIAVLDPASGQLSQIAAASGPVSLPLPSSQVGTPGSPLPTLPHPVIRLSPNNPPVVLSGVNSVSLAVPPPAAAQQSDHLSTFGGALIHAQITSSDSNLGTEAISAEDMSTENNKPSTFTAAGSSPRTQCTASLTYDPLDPPSSEAKPRSPALECNVEPSDLQSEHLPLEDHIYFSSAAAPPSPPVGPRLSSEKLEPLDQLDPLSPAVSPDAMNSRRVLYCQLCPRVFFYLSDLERHAITHSQKKPHVCQQCGKAFKRSSHLQRHKHIHTGQRNFVCPICAKRFREAGELQRHQRVHTGEKPYQCQLCHTRFAERNTLRRHTKRKHPYHQVAMEMLSERRDRGGGGGGGGDGGSGVQEEEESAEWYSSTVSHLDNSESEMET